LDWHRDDRLGRSKRHRRFKYWREILRGAAAPANANSHSYCNSDIHADAMHEEMCTNTEAAPHSAPSAMTLIPK
jgi:hypothetical protein